MSYHSQSPIRDSHNINKKRKRISHESEELAWTAARCNRLLRSITQRIGALKKLVENDFTGTAPKSKQSVEKRVASHWSTQDPVWMGDAKRKTGARTFAGRKKTSQREVPQTSAKSNEISFPSPFVRRFGLGGEDAETISSEVEFVRPAIPARLTRQLPIKAETPRIEAEKGLSAAFSSLLIATNGKAPPKERGARPLMSICLKNVPAYIELNEEGDDEEDSNFASEIMSYLEELGPRENGGWSGLREVVRSQVMYAVCDAIADHVLSDNIIQQLVDQCGLQGSIREGQEILAAWIEAGESFAAKQMATWHTFGRQQKCEASNFRLMRNIGEHDAGRLAGFCKAPRFWNDLLRCLTSASSWEAAAFLSACVKSCLENSVDCSGALGLGVKETITRLTTMAASAMLLKESQADPNSLSCIVHKLAANAIFPDHPTVNKELYHLLINCSILLLGIAQDSHGSLGPIELSNILPPSQKARMLRSDFLTEVISSMTALEQHLNSDLLSLLLECMVEQATIAPLYREVALAVITEKKQSSHNDEDEALYLEYVNIISAKSSGSLMKTPRTPFRKTPKAQFRWEEGICEWVAKTPFTVATMAPPTPKSTTLPNNDKENYIPTPAKSCASVQKEAFLVQNSPDILALSPRKRKVAESPLAPRQVKRVQKSRPVRVFLKKDGRRRDSRLSIRSRAEDESADELGF